MGFASTHTTNDSHVLIGVMDVFGESLGTVRLWDFEREESVRGRVVEKEGKVWDV